jgi:hypothetical protein
MAKQYILKDIAVKAKDLERSFKKAHNVIERAQQIGNRNCGKDKSLLRAACKLGFVCNAAPIHKDGKRYVNPMTFGDKLFLEEMGTYKCVEFKNYEFLDKDGRPVVIDYYGED